MAWAPPTSIGVMGYAFYFGSKSGTYTSRFDVGTNTSITITGLTEGHTNFFAVTAYNAAGIESPLSAEVAYIVPGLARLIAPTGPGKLAGLTFPEAVGHIYSIQASSDLKTWTTVYTTIAAISNVWATWQDPQTGQYPKRFYRLIMN